MSGVRQFFAGGLRWLKHYRLSPLAIPSLASGLSG
jgi:hypothetical protein